MPRRRRSKKWIFRLFVLLLLLAVGVVFNMVREAYFKDKGDIGNDGDAVQVSEVDDSVLSSSSDSKEPEKDIQDYIDKKPIQYDGGSPNEFEYLTGAINYVHINDDRLSIRVSIDQYLEDGTCELVLMRGDDVIFQDSVEIVGDATTSTCKGFDVPRARLTEGEASFTVYFVSGDRVGKVSGGVGI